MGYMDTVQLPGITGTAVGASSGLNPLTALGGMGLEAASAFYGNRMAAKRQHEAFDQQKWMMQNRYQMQTKDMMAAGLNPMLAVNQGAPMPNAPAAAPVNKPDMVNAMANAQISSAQAAKIRQETENLKIENQNLQNTAAAYPTVMTKMAKEIQEIEQRIATGNATKEDTEKLKELHAQQAKLAGQEYDIRRPEQLASGIDAAKYSAMVTRVLKPLIDILIGASKFKP